MRESDMNAEELAAHIAHEVEHGVVGLTGKRKGGRRTKEEIVVMRARINARVEELMSEGVAADQAIAMAKAEERSRRDQEVLEKEVAQVFADTLMRREVDGVEVNETDVARMDGVATEEVEMVVGDEDGVSPVTDIGADTDDTLGDMPGDMPDDPASVRAIVSKLIGDGTDVITDQRRKLPALQMTWGDVDATGAGTRDWDRLPDEPEAWYQGFMVYLHAPPTERGVGATYRSWTKLVGRTRLPSKAVPQEWYRAAQKYAWEARAMAYDKTKTARFVNKMEMVEAEVEDELKDALMTALRKCVERLKTGRLEELSMTTAVDAVPKLVKEIREYLGLGEQNKVSLDNILESLPVQFRQQVLLAINIGTVTVDGQGVARAYDGHQIRSRPLADLTMPDRSLERELRELEEIEGVIVGEQSGASAGE